jgi:uncharacterized protein YbcI
MMCTAKEAKGRIAAAVCGFVKEQLAVHPEHIYVDIHNRSVTVTLDGVLHPAEINLARERPARASVEKMYMELFNVSKPALHSRLEHALGKTVDRSFFAVEPQYGNAVIVLFLSSELNGLTE